MQSYFSESANGFSTERRRGPKRKSDELEIGHDVQLALAKHARRPYSADTSRSLGDRRFTRVKLNRITALFNAYDTDPMIQIAASINLNAALGGSITVTDTADEPASEEAEQDLAIWRAYSLTTFVRSAYRVGKALGFIAWLPIPNVRDKGEARLLNVEVVDTWVHVNALGEPMFAFFEPFSADSLFGAQNMFQGHMVGKPILNVFVTTWDAPSSTGELRSVVANLFEEEEYMQEFRDCATKANRRLANPLFVTSHLPLKFDQKEDTRSLIQSNSERLDKVGQEQLMSAVAIEVQARHKLGEAEFDSVRAAVQRKLGARGSTDEGPRVDIDVGRVLESQVKPDAPKDLIAVTMMHQQLVLMRFGVPPSMVLAESARGRTAGGDDSNSATLFRNAQSSLKQDLVQLVTQVFNVIHNPSKIRDYLMSQPLTRQITDTDIEQAVNTVKIIIAGTPPESELKELYSLGVLKYSAYRRYISQLHCIPLDDLNEEPEISIMDLLTGGKETLQGEQLEGAEDMQGKELKAREKETKMKISAKPKTKPKAKAKSKAKKR